MSMNKEKIPRATARRVPLYYRYLKYLKSDGVSRISSAQFSNILKIDSATIRRDFSYFGALGKRGYGYDVDSLLEFFGDQLHQDQLTHVALVGTGHLGRALLNYSFRGKNNIRISAGFDIDQELVDTLYQGVPIYHVDELEDQIRYQQLKIVILSVPGDKAQEVTDTLVKAGVSGILNFTPMRLDVPDHVLVHDVDLTNELQSMIYFIQYKDMIEDQE